MERTAIALPAKHRIPSEKKIDNLKDLDGTGMGTNGQGDLRITERREAVAALTASVMEDSLTSLGPNVINDRRWVLAANFTDYGADVTPGEFWWADNGYISSAQLEELFAKRVVEAKKRASQFQVGEQSFFEVPEYSLMGLYFIDSPSIRTKALADAVLQYRGQVSRGPVETKKASRIDREGPIANREQNLLLKNQSFDGSPQRLRDYALWRFALGAHPVSSVNGVYLARNGVSGIFKDGHAGRSRLDTHHTTAWVRWETPPGAKHPPYVAIHHNFSSQTPRDIEACVREWLFPLGPDAERAPLFLRLVDALEMAAQGEPQAARAMVMDAPGANSRKTIASLLKELVDAKNEDVHSLLLRFLTGVSVKSLGNFPEQNLYSAAHMYRGACVQEPRSSDLEIHVGNVGGAAQAFAELVAALEIGQNHEDGASSDNALMGRLAVLDSYAQAREALQTEIFNSKEGFSKRRLIQIDLQLERLLNQELGRTVDKLGNLEHPHQKAEALFALDSALRSAIASGLDVLKSDSDEAARKGESLSEVLKDVQRLLESGETDEETFRNVMSRGMVSSQRTIQNIRTFFDERKAELISGKIDIDGQFDDQLIKQTALHYLIAIAQKGMLADLNEIITPRYMANVSGIRLLHSVGPVFFPEIVIAENEKDLKELDPAPSPHALIVLKKADEAKLVLRGGLWIDQESAPGGGSHLVHLAMQNGVSALAVPALATRYSEFLSNAVLEGGVYQNDSNGVIEMMTAGLAREKGLLNDQSEKQLLSGNNRKYRYIETDPRTLEQHVVAEHERIIHPARPTRTVELYVPPIRGNAERVRAESFKAFAKLGLRGRSLVGEKGMVLCMLSSHPDLGKYIPDGSVISSERIRKLLFLSGLDSRWRHPWLHDPKVGRIDDSNFLESAFYNDSNYRRKIRTQIQRWTQNRLEDLLTRTGTDGEYELTSHGQVLYDELCANHLLRENPAWIARSSYPGEDRPGKSGAGLYESYANLRDPVSRIRGIIGVVSSGWALEPIESNVAEQIQLERTLVPAVVVQVSLEQAQTSGVVVTRDRESLARGYISYQVKPGFGGGVSGGAVQEGVVGPNHHDVKIEYGNGASSLLNDEQIRELRQASLDIENYFNEVIEPGSRHAVDIEFVYTPPQKLNIVQARVVLMGNS